MSFEACEALVKAGDPDRWRAARTAPPEGRKALMAIYAANLMIARAPWASSEPLVAQMRLQWWADEIGKIYQGAVVTSHEILPALRAVIFDHNLPMSLFDTLIQARHFDLGTAPHADRTAFDTYIRSTAGPVMCLAALALGAKQAHLPIIQRFAYGAGVAALLRAVPALAARGRVPLPGGEAQIIADARESLASARARRRMLPPTLAPALLAGWRADATLAYAQKDPRRIFTGGLEESPARKTASLRWRQWRGRW
jgi:phytoene/squalene synthetase